MALCLILAPTHSSAKISPLAPVRPLWAVVTAPDSNDLGYAQICTVNSINEDLGLWITAAHCLSHGSTYVEELGEKPIYHDALVIDLDEPLDIGILLTKDYRVTSFKLAKTAPALGDDVAMMGYPMGLRTPIYLRGYVASLDAEIVSSGINYGHKMMFGMAVCGGNSGSAVLNGEGELVSVMQIGPGTPCAPISGGIPYDALVAHAGRYFKP